MLTYHHNNYLRGNYLSVPVRSVHGNVDYVRIWQADIESLGSFQILLDGYWLFNHL